MRFEQDEAKPSHFLDAVVGKPAELVTAREAAYRSAVMGAMYQAAREKKWMAVASSE